MNSFTDNLNQWGGLFLDFAWPMLWQSSLLILVVFAVDFLSRNKIRASVRYALWLVVLVKLCLPPTVALPTGAAWWLFPARASLQTRPVMKYTVTYDTTAPIDTVLPTLPMPVAPPPKLSGAGWALLGCGFVGLILLLWLTFRWWHISRKIRRAVPAERLTDLLGEIRVWAGLRSSLRLKLVDDRMSPAVCGLFRPVILLPRALTEQLSIGQLRAVLLHEAFHLRRKDVWVNCAQALLQIVYWWHPFLWLANARIRRLREEAVDDAVMLALSGKAEDYAPTLLAVAKLAFNRPLMSLGLVGIMESRSALRKRIERLVNFRAPRKAGLTFLSLCGILIFGAVALPMGEASGPVEKSDSTDPAAVAQQSLTLKVNPETFIKNVKAQAAPSLLSPTNDYTDILLELLRTEGVDCTPPHGIAFNTQTGEITTHNTPDQLEIFREVVEQLNRSDGPSELPLSNNPLRKRIVLIEARIYQMPSANFDDFVSGLRFYRGRSGEDDWWSASPEQFQELVQNLESSGLQLIQRPRIQTASGITAEFYVGNGTNNVEFDCKPYVADGYVDLTLRGAFVHITGASAVLTNNFRVNASAEDRGGLVVRVKKYGGDTDNNLLAAISVETVTNSVSPRFQTRLQSILVRANSSSRDMTTNGRSQLTPGTGMAGNSTAFVERARVTISDKAAAAHALVSDAKVLYEMGKLDDAEKSLQSALVLQPDNQSARYYMNLVQAARANRRPGIVQTSPARKVILDKLNRIQLDRFGPYIRLPLGEVVRELNQMTAGLVSDKTGIRFFVANSANGHQPVIDPDIGMPVKEPGSKSVDINSVIVTINPALTNVTLASVLDVIAWGADKHIKYSISDEGIVFSPNDSSEAPRIYARSFKLNTNVFLVNLQRQVGIGTDVAVALRQLFLVAGVDLFPPKAIFYNDGMGLLYVRATEPELDKVEKIIVSLNSTVPQIHIKARFFAVPKGTLAGFGKMIDGTNQLDQITGILTSGNAKVALNNLEPRPGVEELAEPEVTTTSGRQTQMRATRSITVVTNFTFEETSTNTAVFPQTTRIEAGPILDVIPTALGDGYTIDLTTIASVTEFLGYDQPSNTAVAYTSKGQKINLPTILPAFAVRKASTNIRLLDNQTAVLGALKARFYAGGKEVAAEPDFFMKAKAARGQPDETDRELLVFITATLIDPVGNRIHSDADTPFAKNSIPPQDGQ